MTSKNPLKWLLALGCICTAGLCVCLGMLCMPLTDDGQAAPDVSYPALQFYIEDGTLVDTPPD